MKFVIRPVRNEEELNMVRSLCYEEYLKKGICLENTDRQLVHYGGYFDTIDAPYGVNYVLVATLDEVIVGTISITSSKCTTPIERDFHKEMTSFRGSQRGFLCVWRLAVSEEHRKNWHIVCALMNAAIEYAVVADLKYLLCSVSPQRVDTYKAFGFVKYSTNERASEFLNTPAVFVCMPVNVHKPTALLRRYLNRKMRLK